MEMGYLTVLHVGLGAKIGDLHAKDSNSFRNRLIVALTALMSRKRHLDKGVASAGRPPSLLVVATFV